MSCGKMKSSPCATQKPVSIVVSPIPFERPAAKTLVRNECHTHKFCANPADNVSLTCELSVPFFSTGAPEEWLKFKKNL